MKHTYTVRYNDWLVKVNYYPPQPMRFYNRDGSWADPPDPEDMEVLFASHNNVEIADLPDDIFLEILNKARDIYEEQRP